MNVLDSNDTHATFDENVYEDAGEIGRFDVGCLNSISSSSPVFKLSLILNYHCLSIRHCIVNTLMYKMNGKQGQET